MSTVRRMVVRDNSNAVEVARGYYPQADKPLTNRPGQVTQLEPVPVAIPMYKELYRSVGPGMLEKVPLELDLTIHGISMALISILGVSEVRIYPDHFTVCIHPPYNWDDVDEVVIEVIRHGFGYEDIERVGFPDWRKQNLPQSINPLDSVEYKSSLNKQSRLIERLMDNATEEMAKRINLPEVYPGEVESIMEEFFAANELPIREEKALGESILAKLRRAQNRDLVSDSIKSRQAEEAAKASEDTDDEGPALRWPEDYPPGAPPPPTLCSD